MVATRGCKFLLHIPNDEIHGVEQMSYDDRKKMAFGISIEEQRIYSEPCLEDKIKTIE